MAGALDGPLIALVAIGGGLLLGWLLFQHFGESSATVNSVFGLIGRSLWIIAGIGFIIGGFIVAGVLLITLGLFLALGHWSVVKDADLRRKIAGG